MNYKKSQKPQSIKNPEAWIGKYVRHLANWRDYQFGDEFVVCEFTGKLIKREDEAYYGDFWDSLELAHADGYDECYYYSYDGLRQMWESAHKSKALKSNKES